MTTWKMLAARGQNMLPFFVYLFIYLLLVIYLSPFGVFGLGVYVWFWRRRHLEEVEYDCWDYTGIYALLSFIYIGLDSKITTHWLVLCMYIRTYLHSNSGSAIITYRATWLQMYPTMNILQYLVTPGSNYFGPLQTWSMEEESGLKTYNNGTSSNTCSMHCRKYKSSKGN